MAQPNDSETPPWRRLFHEKEEQQSQQLEQQQQQAEEEPLTELQQQLQGCYRKTFLVAGCGLVGSMWRWNMVTKHKQQDVFLPPRAQALPQAVVERWRQKALFREGLHTVGRQTLFITCIAGLYFGTELGVGLLRGDMTDWANTAAAGVVAGGLLGLRVPSSMRGRTLALGSTMGGLMGALSGWTQLQLLALAGHDSSVAQQGQAPQQRQ